MVTFEVLVPETTFVVVPPETTLVLVVLVVVVPALTKAVKELNERSG